MSKVQTTKFKAVDDIRDRLNRLHAARGGWVVAARDARLTKGVTSCNFGEAWGKAEDLTDQIEQAQRELDAAVREAEVCVMPIEVGVELVMALDSIRLLPRWDDVANLKEVMDVARHIANTAIEAFEAHEAHEAMLTIGGAE